MLRRSSCCPALTLGHFVAIGLLSSFAILEANAALRTLDSTRYHLRSGKEAEWQEFAGKTPHGRRLDIQFIAKTNSGEATLLIRQSDVKLDWPVELNGLRLGKLFLMEPALVFPMAVPPGGLRDGSNTLSILPPTQNDDITVGDFQLDERPLHQGCEAAVEGKGTDADSRAALPCRITIVDEQGALAAFDAST